MTTDAAAALKGILIGLVVGVAIFAAVVLLLGLWRFE
jgi:hypothetical protein